MVLGCPGCPWKILGGERGIRTPDTLSGTSVFKTDAINHSASSPQDVRLQLIVNVESNSLQL